MAKRKTDRRTIYTKNVIKDSLLALLNHSSYEKISVTALCKQSEITRTTFYLHYNNIDAVLNELLDEALRLTELDSGFSSSPISSTINTSLGNPVSATVNSDDSANETSDSYDPDALLPVCQRAASNPKYRILFLDKTMSHYILEKLYRRAREKKIPEIMNIYHVSEWEADKLFLYMLNGSFAVNKSLGWNKNAEWYQAQKIIQKLIQPNL
ncbi:TetR/AcrR family transcriptional regulator [Clostridium estertheticum]|uniref:TetR/AcrR family transcriptional regulator n=1 Tax=Clostridium estertheticum TaxID=238834 RepID=UPI001C0E497B|nr:TetR/AcrR family transcriptional regulator [Clostridium estertheticum]MBU3174620.1 hypothetical protein [Clostridium estertheticum]